MLVEPVVEGLAVDDDGDVYFGDSNNICSKN